MSYVAPTVRTTGDLITASIYNTDLVGNISAIFGGAMGLSGQVANDVLYAASASQLARLAMDASSGKPLASVSAGAPVWGGDMDWLGALLKNAELKGFSETSPNPAIAANVLTVDYKAGNVVRTTLSANITTTTLQNIPASTKFASFTLIVSYNGSGSTWAWLSSTVKWAGGSAPALTGTNGKTDVFQVWTLDGGATWSGAVVGQNFS